jgi:uncharacterized protein (DUF2164 family)
MIIQKFELSDEFKRDAIDSLRTYFENNMEYKLGNLPAELLLDFLIENIGAIFYNQAISDVQKYLIEKVDDLYGLMK